MFKRTRDFFTLYRSLVRDPRVPSHAKWLPWAALLYALFPIDLVPDFFPLLGQADDLTAIIVLLMIAINAISQKTYDEHRAKRGDVIDVTPKDAD